MFTRSGISRRLRIGVIAIALAGPGSAAMVMAATPALAHGRAPNCWCVDYIKHSYGINGPTGHAKDMGPNLVRSYDFHKRTEPVVGAIVVFQPAYGPVDQEYGHVGRILGVSDAGSRWKLTVRSANYGGTNHVLDCRNVNDKPFYVVKGSRSVAFYKR